jgi:transcriptional regulator with XRE-family HTH domain
LPQFEEVGKLLRAARGKLGLSQEEFASALGVKVSRLQKWESGVNEPHFTISELRRIRGFNREVFDAITSGFLLLRPPAFIGLLSHEPPSNRAKRHPADRRGGPAEGRREEDPS